MPDFTLNPKQTIDLDKPIATVNVHIGSALVVLPGKESKPHFLDADSDTLDCGNLAPATIWSPDAAVLTVVYTEEVPAGPSDDQIVDALKTALGGKSKRKAAKRKAAERGDTGGGDSGGFGSRTVKQLRAEAKKRKIKVGSKATKDELVAALRKA